MMFIKVSFDVEHEIQFRWKLLCYKQFLLLPAEMVEDCNDPASCDIKQQYKKLSKTNNEIIIVKMLYAQRKKW